MTCDAVGQLSETIDAAGGQRMPAVLPEQPRTLPQRLILDHDRDILDPADHVVGERVELLGDHPLEVVIGDLDHVPIVRPRRLGTPCCTNRGRR